MREFQRSTVRVADVAAGEHVILQQRVNLSPVSLGMIFEHNRIEIERRHAGKNVDLEPSVSIFTICAFGRTSGALVSTSTVAVVCSPIS